MADTQINIGINLDSDNLIKGIDNAQYKIKALGNVISGVSVAALEAALSNLPTQKVKDVAASFESVSKSLQNTPQKELAQPLAKVNAKELKGVGEGIAAIAAALTAFDENKLNQVSQGLANVSLAISQLPIGNIQKLTTELKSINKISGEIQPTNLQNTATAISALNKEITGLSYVQLSQVAVATGQLNLQINGIKEAAVATKELSKAANEIKPTLLAEFSATAKDLPTKNADAFANAIKSLANNTTALSSNALSEISKASLVIAGQTTNLQGSAAAIKTIGENSKTIDPKPLNAIIDSTNKANPDLISKAATSISGLIKEVGNVSYAPLTNVAVAISQVGLQLNSIKETVTNTKDLTKAINELKAAPFNELSTSIKALTPKSIDDFANAVKSLEKNVSATSANNLNEISKSVAGISGQLNSVQSIATSIKTLSDSLKEVDFKPLKGLVDVTNKATAEPITKISGALNALIKEIASISYIPLSQTAVAISQVGLQSNVIKETAVSTKDLGKQIGELKTTQIEKVNEIIKGLPLKSVDEFNSVIKLFDKSLSAISANNLNEVSKSINLISNQTSLIQSNSDAVKSLGTSLKTIDHKPLNSAIDAGNKANPEPIKKVSDSINDLNKSIMGIFPTLISDVSFNAAKLGYQNTVIKTAALNFDSLAKSINNVKFDQISDFSKAATSLSPKNIDSISNAIKSLGSSVMGIFPSILSDAAKSAGELGSKSTWVKSTAEAVKTLSTSLEKVDPKPLSEAVKAANQATYTPLTQTASAVTKLTTAINGIFPTLLSDVAFAARQISFQTSSLKLAADNTNELAKSILEIKAKPLDQLSSAINSLAPKSVGEFSKGIDSLVKSINAVAATNLNEVLKSVNSIALQTSNIQSVSTAIKSLSESTKEIDFKPLKGLAESANKFNSEPLIKTTSAVNALIKEIGNISYSPLTNVAVAISQVNLQLNGLKETVATIKDLSKSTSELKSTPFSQLHDAIKALTPKALDELSKGIGGLTKAIDGVSATPLSKVFEYVSAISAQASNIQLVSTSVKSLSDSIKEIDHKPLKSAVESGNKANSEPVLKTANAINVLAKEISEVPFAALSNVAVAAGQVYLQSSRIKETATNIKELGKSIKDLSDSSEKLTATSKKLETLLAATNQISKISTQINSQKILELDSAIAKINTTVLPVITTQLKELSDSVKLVSNSTIKKLSDSINLVNVNKLNETTAAILALTPALNAISTSSISATATYLKEITETKKGVSDLNNAIKEFNSVTQKVTETPYAGVSKELDNLSKKVTAVNSNKILDIGAGLELIGSAAVKLNPQVVSHLSKNISDLTKQTVQLNTFASTAKTLSTNINAINPQIVNALATAISKINDTKTEAAGKALKNIGDAISSLKTNVLLDTAAGLELIGTSQTFVAQTSKHIVNVSNALEKMSKANKQLASVSDNIGYIGINVGTIKSGILNNLANYSQQLGNSAPKLREFRDVLKEISKAADGIKSKGLVSLTNLIVGFNTNKIIEISLDLIDLSQVLAAIPVDKLKQLNSAMKVSVTGNLKVTADSLERIGKAVMNIFPSLIQDAVAAMKGFAGVGASVQRAASSLSDFAKANNEIKPKQLNAIGAAFDKFAKGLIKLDVNKISDAASAIEKLSVVIANINTQPLLNTAAGVANIGVIAKVTTKEINALFDALSKPQQTPEQKAAAEAEKQRLKEEKEAKKAAAAAEKQRIKEEKAAAKEAAAAEKRAAKELREAEKAAAKEAAAAKKAEIEATKKSEQEKVNFAKKLLREELAAKKAVAEQDKVLAGVERASDLASKKYQAVQKYLDLEQEHAAKVRQAIKAFDLKSYEENANAAKKAHEDAKKAREAADISTNEYSKRALAFVEIAHTRAAALGKALEQKTNQLKSLSENATKAERAAAEASVKIAKEAADKAVKIAQDAANKAAQIKQVDRPVVAKNPELEQWASTRGFREAFYEIGREIKSFFTESFHTFKEFDDQVRKAASLMGTEFLTTVNEINKSSLKLSETTRYTATQIAESFGVLAMNGLNLKEAMSAIPVVLDLAEAGAYSVERTTEILIGTVHSFNLSVDSMKSVANAMTNAMTTSALSMQRIAYTVQYAGTTADAANQSFGQMLGIMGVLANQNIVGSKAGTALRTAYLELQVEGGKLTRTLQDLAQRQVALDGVTNEGTATAQQFATAQKDAAGKVRPLIDVLEDMKVKGANAGDVFNAFGKYAMGSINALIKPGQTLAESIDKVRVQQERVFGITEKTAKQFVMNMRSGVSETATVLNKFGIDVLATDAKIGKTTAIKDIFSVMADAKQKGADFAEIAKTFVKGWDTKEGRKEFELLMKVFNSGKTTAKELADAYSEANGRANEVAQQMESGIGGAVRKLQGAYQALQIKIWESFSDETVEKVLSVKKALVASTPAIANITGVFIKAGLVIVDAVLAFLKFTDHHSGAIIALGLLVAAIVILKYQLIELTGAMLGRVVGGFVATTTAATATAFSVKTLRSSLSGLIGIAKNLAIIGIAAASVYGWFQLITTAIQAWNASSDKAAKSQELVKSLKDKKEALESAGYTEKRINELNAEQLQTYKAGLIGQLGVIDEIKMRKEAGLSISKQEREELQKEAQLRKELGMIKNRFIEDPKIKQSAVAQKEEMEREAAQRQAILDSQTAKYKKLSEIQLAGEIAYTQALQKGNSYLEEREKSAIQKKASVDIAQINQETAALEARARASVLDGKGEKFDENFYLNKAKRIAEIESKSANDILTIEKNRVTVGNLLNDKMYILKKTQAENTIKDGDQLNRKMNDLERENIEARISLQEKYYKSVQSAYQKISKELEDFKLKSINLEKDIVAEKTSLQDKLFDLKLKDRNKQLDLERSLANEKMSLEDKLFELRLKNKSEPEKQAAYSAKSSELIAKAFAPTADIETSKKLLDNAESMVSKINDATVAESLLTEISRRRLELLSREKGDRDNALKQQKEINLSAEEALKKSQELARAGDLKGSVEYGKIAEIAKAKDAFLKAKSLADAGDIEGSKKLLESAEQQASKLERVKDAEKLITDISAARVALLEKEKAANQQRIDIGEKNASDLATQETNALNQLKVYQDEIGKLSETGMSIDLTAKLNADKLKEELGILKKEVDAMNATVTVHHATSGGEGFPSNPQMRNAGGWVDGVGDSDTVPAMLTPNEYVVTARQGRSKLAAPILEFIGKAPISKVTTFVERVKNGVTKLNAGGFVMPRLNPSMLMNLPNLGNLPKPSAPKDRYLQPFVLNLGGKNMPPLPTPEENMREFILALQQS